MSATELIDQFKSLSAEDRAQVAKFIVENDESWIPASFREGMADIDSGRTIDLETALTEKFAEGE